MILSSSYLGGNIWADAQLFGYKLLAISVPVT